MQHRDDSGNRNPFIVGVADIDLVEGIVGEPTNPLRMQADAILRALDDAGLSLTDVDGLLTAGSWYPGGVGAMPLLALTEYLGISPTFIDGTNIGGSSFQTHVGHAAQAISQGLCRVAVVTYGSLQRSERSRSLGGWGGELMLQYEQPWGVPAPVGSYAMAARRHMHVHDTTSSDLARVAVAARRWASSNPHATKREPLTVDDVLASPMIADPLHRDDCCLVTDGGGAIVLTSQEGVNNRSRAIEVVGYGESVSHFSISSMADLTVTPAAVSGRNAMRMAGVTVEDIDVAELYDSFTVTVLLQLENLGFCAPGDSGPFVQSGAIDPGGQLPLNTNGGGLSYAHPGMYGIFLIIEAVRQLRGEAVGLQVNDPSLALVSGMGGRLSSAATLVLNR